MPPKISGPQVLLSGVHMVPPGGGQRECLASSSSPLHPLPSRSQDLGFLGPVASAPVEGSFPRLCCAGSVKEPPILPTGTQGKPDSGDYCSTSCQQTGGSLVHPGTCGICQAGDWATPVQNLLSLKLVASGQSVSSIFEALVCRGFLPVLPYPSSGGVPKGDPPPPLQLCLLGKTPAPSG